MLVPCYHITQDRDHAHSTEPQQCLIVRHMIQSKPQIPARTNAFMLGEAAKAGIVKEVDDDGSKSGGGREMYIPICRSWLLHSWTEQEVD